MVELKSKRLVENLQRAIRLPRFATLPWATGQLSPPTQRETEGFLFGEVMYQGRLELKNTMHSVVRVGGADCCTENWELQNRKTPVLITEDCKIDKLTCKREVSLRY